MIKNLILSLLAAAFFFSCTAPSSKDASSSDSTAIASQQSEAADLVRVYYFHGKQRCKTCLAVEKLARETVSKNFTDTSKVRFMEINTSDKEQQGLVEKYQITWNALIVARAEEAVDLTEKAFATAVNQPEELESLLLETINSLQD